MRKGKAVKQALDGARIYRQRVSMENPLRGLSIDEVVAIARYIGVPYASYGKLMSYVSATGKLPPEPDKQ